MKKKELMFLIQEGEGFNLEFKESDKDLSREICAFANANGGKILLGVSDSGRIKGVTITNRLKSQIVDLARNFDPRLEITLSRIDNVLIVNVPEGTKKPYSVNGKFYLRYGPNSQQLGREEIREFFYKEGLILWDETANKEFNIKTDLSAEAFNQFIKLANISPGLSQKEILQNLFLLKERRLKNAGVLMFAKDIAQFFIKAIVTCVLYEGTDKVNIIDKKDFTGDLYSNYREALNYLKAKLNTRIIITAGPHEKKLELPEDALREALVNALGHRDYNVRGAKILVEIFFDRVEIINPGGLTKGLRRKDFGKKSLSRNPLLFGLLQRINLVENVGSGIKRMRDLMLAEKLEEPKFEISEDWFTVIFKRPPLLQTDTGATGGATGGATELLNYIEKNPGLRVVHFVKALKVPKRTIERWVKQLKDEGRIRYLGSSKKGGYWEVKK